MTRRLAAGWSIGLGLGAAVLLCLHQPLGHWLAVLPLPQCRFHQLTGFLCPACGNTRAVLALLQGHPLRSIGYNPMIFTLFAALTCLYAELVCTAVGKPRRILPRSNALLFLTVGIVLGYDIVRNFFPFSSRKAVLFSFRQSASHISWLCRLEIFRRFIARFSAAWL